MNILVINLDKGIFSRDSASLARLKEYCQLVEKIFVIVWTNKKEEPITFQDKLFIYPTNSSCRLFYFLDSWRLAQKITEKNKIDLIFTQDPFETGLVGWLLSKIKKIPLQIQIHTDFLSPHFGRESFINKVRLFLAKFLTPSAKSLRVVSERIKRSITASIKFPAEKIFVLPIFVDVKKIQEAVVTVDLHQKYPQFNFVILMASRLTRGKNISLAIEAMCDLVKKNPKVGLIIVGNGPEEKKFKLQVVNYNLQDWIKFETWTNDIYSYYKTADLFLLTSNYEGYGLSVIEAMAAGCPVIMTEVGCAVEIVRNGENGLIIPVGDKDKLVAAINYLISNQELQQRLVEDAKKVVNQLPTKNDYLNCYKESWDKTV